jgi:hypothetical protein
MRRGSSMTDDGAFEVMHAGRVHRAASMETVMRWARERRITVDDSFRKAGDDRWLRVADNRNLADILDPSTWWAVRMEDREYTAPDFETVVEWTREGRLSTEAVIEGPRTPPGGVLASGLPGLAPFLREPPRREPSEEPPRIRIDGRDYLPGSIDRIREWIRGSRVPLEAEISLDGGEWEPISECGLFELELWPTGAHGEGVDEGEDEHGKAPSAPDLRTGKGEAQAPDVVPEREGDQRFTSGVPLRVVTLAGEFEIAEPPGIFDLLDAKKVHSFDEVRHPDLPDGACSVSKMIEVLGLRRRRGLWWVWVIAALLALAAAAVFLKPFGLFS